MWTLKRLQVVATLFFILLYFTVENKAAAASEGMSERETQTLICSPFLHHSCKWHKDVPKIKFRIIQTCIPLFILSTFQAPPPTLVSRLMKNFAASWKTEPGWGHQNTPPRKCKTSIHTLELLSPDSWTSIVALVGYCFAVHLWGNPFFFHFTSSGTFPCHKWSDHLWHMCSKRSELVLLLDFQAVGWSLVQVKSYVFTYTTSKFQ